MKSIGRFFLVIFSILLIFVGILLFRTFSFSSIQAEVLPVPVSDVSPLARAHLSEAIRFRTISNLDPALIDSSEFAGMHKWIASTYPLVDSLLNKKVFNTYSLLYKWEGKNPELPPAVLMGHMDVVPVPEENLKSWKQPPFAGIIEGGEIWGRGAIDDKINVVGLLEAVNSLLNKGFQPERSLYLSFGHDEEVSGVLGAKTIVEYLKAEGVRPDFVLDEGYTLTEGLIPGMDRQVAIIGIAEKGYCSIRISAELDGGHSSIPQKETAIEIISQAIHRLHEHPFPEKISYPLRAFFQHLGPEMPFVNKMAFGNHRIFKPLILDIYGESNTGSALIKTTMVPTIFHAGIKDNVIPREAHATFNFRLLPGDTLDVVRDHLQKWINDERVNLQVIQYQPPSPVSRENTPSYKELDKTIREIFPGTLVTPNLVVGATDARYFHEICDKVYRFAPYPLTPATVSMFHGINERIKVEDFDEAVRFYGRLIENLCQ